MFGKASQKRIWIAWERQRRSLELSRCFQSDLFLVIEKGLLRYPLCIFKTFLIIKRERPDVLFVQNPSMILALFATTLFRLFFKYYVVVDRHSNFLLTPIKRPFIVKSFFHFLSFVTINYANLTIVTNDQLVSVIEVLGGRAKILPDKIPSLSPVKVKPLRGVMNVLVISSFASDEPIAEIGSAADKLAEKNIFFYFTGDFSKSRDADWLRAKENVSLTGFISDQDFVDLLFSVDAVLVLTTMDYTLLCGCYEAVSVGKVLITSDSLALKSLFKGALFVKNTSEDIVKAVEFALNNREKLELDINRLRIQIDKYWNHRFNQLEEKVRELE